MSNYDEQKVLELKRNFVLCNPYLNPVGFIDHIFGKKELQKVDSSIAC